MHADERSLSIIERRRLGAHGNHSHARIPTERSADPAAILSDEAIAANPEDPALEALYDAAVRDTIASSRRPSPVITDGDSEISNFGRRVQGSPIRLQTDSRSGSAGQSDSCSADGRPFPVSHDADSVSRPALEYRIGQ